MTFIQLYGFAGLSILGLMILLWIVSLIVKNSSIIDSFWGFGFVFVNWIAFILIPIDSDIRRWLISILVTIWGLRLSIHIFLRNAGKGEDFRYRKWRDENGKRWWWFSFFQVFLLQGILMWIVCIPLVAVQFFSTGTELSILDLIGGILWLIGFFFEAVGDAQLINFRKNPANKGKLLSFGVWKYTRHPNYFGDAAQWWGFYLLSLTPGAFWTIFSPILMTFLLVRVSGVALLEKTLIEKKPGYREYAQSTNAFIPWFPRKKKESPKE